MAVSELKRIGRAAFVAFAVAVGIAASSCGEYVRNNPFDPAVPVTLTIHGPDSAFAQFDTLRFTVTTDPVYDYDDVQWESGGLQKIDNNGMYQVGPTSVFGGRATTVPVTVRIGTRTATKNVYINFKPVGFSARFCGDVGRAVLLDGGRTAILDWIGESVNVCANILDARGGIITTSLSPQSAARPLDTTIVKLGTYGTLAAVGNGTTGVVFTNGSLVDTVKVTVRQSAYRLTVTPSACMPPPFTPTMVMTLGDTLRLTLGPPAYDVGGTQITDAAIIQQAVASAMWGPDPFQGAVAIGVTSDGLVTATTRGLARLGAVLPTTGAVPPGPVATCMIQVQ
jgi:hypothetical protein